MPTLNVVAGVVAAATVLAVVILGRLVVAYARSDDLGASVMRTGRWTWALVLGMFGLVSTGIMQFGDIIGGLFGFVVGHPYTVSNGIGIGLGALGISGALRITTDQYVGLALMAVGVVFLFTEVDQYVGR